MFCADQLNVGISVQDRSYWQRGLDSILVSSQLKINSTKKRESSVCRKYSKKATVRSFTQRYVSGDSE